MKDRNSLTQETNTRRGRSPGALALCRAIIEDAEDARHFSMRQRSALELHSVLPFGPAEIRHGSVFSQSELTNLAD